MSILNDLNGPGVDASSQIVAAMVATPLQRTCSPFSTVTEAVLIFRDEKCGAIPVVDAGKPVGIVTDRDVALAVVKVPELAEQPVSRIMNRDVTTVSSEAPVEEIIRSMVASNAQALFTVDESGRLNGVITWPGLTARLPLGAMIDVLDPLTTEHE